jgi:predicted amidohydrolase YtcJ
LGITPEKLNQAMLMINRYGWRPAIHIQGDKTLDYVLDAYEAADRESSIRDQRWLVEHIPQVHPDQMDRLARLGVRISTQTRPYSKAKELVDTLGKKRAEEQDPMRTLINHHLVVTSGSDWPARTNNPFVNIYYYVTRNTVEEGPLGVSEKLTREEAIRAATINNAYLTFEENAKGSIEQGKLADFVILSGDILTVPEDKIKSILPLATYVGGRRVFHSSASGF